MPLAKGFQFTRQEAAYIEPLIDRLSKRKSGLRDVDLVKLAEQVDHPMRAIFDRRRLFDDAYQGEQARLNFARYIIRAFDVEIAQGESVVTVRRFVPRDTAETSYVPAMRALSDETLRIVHLRRLQDHARSAAEDAAAWAWAISACEPATEYAEAARKFAEAPLPS